MSYRIKVNSVEAYKGEIQFTYKADTYPAVGEKLYYRDIRLKVVEVGHIIGSAFHIAGENNQLDYVELIVTYT